MISANVNLSGIEDVTSVKIYCGNKDVNRDPIVDLLKSRQQTMRVLIQGNFTSSDLLGSIRERH